MLSQMATDDLTALRSEGILPTDEQVVNLHALGVLVERGPFSGKVFHAPRVGWAGTEPLFEPTIQSERWYSEKAAEWWCGQSLFWALAWACRNAAKPGFFARWQAEGPARAAITRWAENLPCTVPQLNAALTYAIQGAEMPPDAPQSAQVAPESLGGCPCMDLVDSALASNFGLTPERIAVMPRRRVIDILRKWTENQIAANGGGGDIDKGAKTDAYVRYDDYLISIRAGGSQIYG